MNGRVVVSNGPRLPFEIREYSVADPGAEWAAKAGQVPRAIPTL
jgi:hypothetical protein